MSISFSDRVKIPDDVLISKLQEESVILNLDSERYYGLDDVGTRFLSVLTTSESIEADSWGFQQIVTSAWPRKLEKEAKAEFVLNGEPVLSSCQLVDKQREVSLVYCP